MIVFTVCLACATDCTSQGTLVSPSSEQKHESCIPNCAFDTVSIHESRGGNLSFVDNIPKNSYFHAERIRVLSLVSYAYGVDLRRVVNLPSWASAVPYDVTAKSDAATDEVLRKMSQEDSEVAKHEMLQGMLADRFQLRIHSETRKGRTWELLATGRAKQLMIATESNDGETSSSCTPRFSAQGLEIDSKGCKISSLLMYLDSGLDGPAVDRTGMTGTYAFHVTWNDSSPKTQTNEEAFPSSREAARDQLGLTLVPVEEPVMVWVIDHIDRPTPN